MAARFSLLLIAIAAVWAEPPQGWLAAGSNPKGYEMTRDTSVKRTGTASGHMKQKGPDATGFGTLMQVTAPGELRGKRVRLTMWIKAEGADSVAPWMRVDSQTKMSVQFDNRPTSDAWRSRKEWTRHETVLDVPNDTFSISYGLILRGSGEAWLDDVLLDVVDSATPSTNMGGSAREIPKEQLEKRPPAPAAPVNLGFEN